MGAFGRNNNLGDGVGIGLSYGSPQMLNVLDTYIPVHDEEVVAFGFGHRLVNSASVSIAIYDISLSVESAALVQVFTPIVNTSALATMLVFELPRGERVRLNVGNEYAVASKVNSNNWLFYSSTHQDSYMAQHDTLTGADAFPVEGWTLPNTQYASPSFAYTRKSLATRIEQHKNYTMP